MYHVLISLLLFTILPFSISVDIITPNTPFKDGDLLVSTGESFALGFFSPSNSSIDRYVGVWYNKVSEQTIVWVANRDHPINGTSGFLAFDKTGNLVLRGQNLEIPVWSTNVSINTTTNTDSSAQLLDTGNLVLFHGDGKRVITWQSFDYPANTWLPYMKLGLDRRTGLNRFLTSWKSAEDPGIGEYSYKFDIDGSPQLFLYKGSARVWRTGPWNGVRWSGLPEMTQGYIINDSYVNNDDEVYWMYSMYNASILSMVIVNETGRFERFTWHEGDRKWIRFFSAPKDQCDGYNLCGAFGNCDPNNNASDFQCTCLTGFEPKVARDWYLRDGSSGCKRKRGGQVCKNGEGFVKVARTKIPDTTASTHVDKSLGLQACEEMCLKNCSCTGYTCADINTGSGCITWHGEMIDTRQFSNGGQDLYIRVDAVELGMQSILMLLFLFNANPIRFLS